MPTDRLLSAQCRLGTQGQARPTLPEEAQRACSKRQQPWLPSCTACKCSLLAIDGLEAFIFTDPSTTYSATTRLACVCSRSRDGHLCRVSDMIGAQPGVLTTDCRCIFRPLQVVYRPSRVLFCTLLSVTSHKCTRYAIVVTVTPSTDVARPRHGRPSSSL